MSLTDAEVNALANALYRLEWNADLYATPQSNTTERYERRAQRLRRDYIDPLLARVSAALAAPDTIDGQANDCRHDSATGVDTSPIGPQKVWSCDHCGLRWRTAEDLEHWGKS